MVINLSEYMSTGKPLIKEVIIENFMSYEYARVPFKSGVNIIMGPNGAGKSSILLALAVALGQTYTERGRRLCDLIRRGKSLARVTVVIDNSPRNGVRPIPRWRHDEFYLTRYLKSDGTYWHEANYKVISKNEVLRLLSRIGINPDNSLIIMHQNMIEEFAVINPIEKLRLVEEAVGLKMYRDRIVSARRELEYVLSEEENINSMLEKALSQLSYWKEKYERYLKKLELIEKKKELEAELAWAKYLKKLNEYNEIGSRLEDLRERLSILRKNRDDIERSVLSEEKAINKKEKELRNNLRSLAKLSRAIIRGNISPDEALTEIDELEAGLEYSFMDYRRLWHSYLDDRIKLSLTDFKIELTVNEIKDIERRVRRTSRELGELRKVAETYGIKVISRRSISEIEQELRVIDARINALADVSPEVEEVYNKYLSAVEDLKKKARIVAENRQRALEELEKRKIVWKRKIMELVSKVGDTYRKFLATVDATGDIRVTNIDDIENAGLELLVGFRGLEPTVLDAYTQSGGERTTAIMCFLLALQQYIKSPFRAIDEFEVHMDPRNRERIMSLLLDIAASQKDTQYVIITPGPIHSVNDKVNIILVQNVKGVSKVLKVRK